MLLTLLAVIPTFAQTAGNWTNTGPILFPTNSSGQINGIGRITQLKFHPSNSQKFYATSASGGLWISYNAGQSWRKTGTENMPLTACASVCVDFTNDQILYLGTGDPNYYSTDLGVWKSTDGGATWAQSNSGIGTRMAVEMIMDPNDHNTIVAATNSGIWKTINGGASWTQKLNTGAFRDMKLNPGSTSILYAVTASAFYRSTDFGENWTQITSGLTGTGSGMRIAVTPANASIVYVCTINSEGRVYKSTDSGVNFTTVYNNPAQSLVGYDANGGGQGDYNFAMTCDPNNANRVFVAAHVIWRSDDGGVSWTQYTDWWADLHTDIHGVNFNPYNTQHLYCSNDGGIFYSLDMGDNWDQRCDSLGATEIYNAGQSNLTRDKVGFGTQDNGELYYANNTSYTNRGGDWTPRYNFDFQNQNYAYYIQNGERRNITGGGDLSLNLPYTPTSSSQIVFNPMQPNMAFTGEAGLWRTSNLSAGTPTWTSVNTYTQQTKALGWSFNNANVLYVVKNNTTIDRSNNALAATPTYTNLTAPASTTGNTRVNIAPVTSDVNVVYMSIGAQVFRSSDQGASWTNITANLPGNTVIGLVEDRYAVNEAVYVATSTGVYYRDNTLSNWVNYSNGLPTISVIQNLMIYSDGTSNSVLRISTYGRGIWSSPLNSPNAVPFAMFVASATNICPGTTVQFTDQSAGSPTSWSWSFPGGTPSSSTLQNPQVVYNNPGVYNVTLTATNGNGSNTANISSYINVLSTLALPLTEPFAGNFPPANWSLNDDLNNNIVWEQNTSVGGYGNSTESAVFDNYNNDVAGAQDELQTSVYDLTTVTTAVLQFDAAYARYDASYSDTLEVLVSTDCGQTFTSVYLKGGTQLSTAPDNTSAFTPTATQWRTETVNMQSYVGQTILIVFRNRGHYGQFIYLDNINLSSTTMISEPTSSILMEVYPNPNSGEFTLNALFANDDEALISVYDLRGAVLYEEQVHTQSLNRTISLTNASAGMYYVQIKTKEGTVTRKIVIEK
jgi:PKD repeat protein